MFIRKIKREDKEAVLTSFKPMFGDWDYLPLVIDDWLDIITGQITWVVFSDSTEQMLVAMGQAYEISPGDWYLRGLRSNAAQSITPVAARAQAAYAASTTIVAVSLAMAWVMRQGSKPKNSQRSICIRYGSA